MPEILSRHRPVSLLAAVLLAQVFLLAFQIKTGQDVRLIRVWAVELLTPVDLSEFAMFAPSGTSLSGDRTELNKWQKDPKSRTAIEKRLADKGLDESVILAKAFV